MGAFSQERSQLDREGRVLASRVLADTLFIKVDMLG